MIDRRIRFGTLALILASMGAVLAPMSVRSQEDPGEELQKQIEAFQRQLQQQLQNMPRGGFNNLAPRPGRLGVRLEPPSEVLREQLGLASDQGLVVSEVVEGSVADKAGLKTYDILMEFDDKIVTPNPVSFVKMVGGVKADATVDIVVLRKGRKETIKGVKLPEAAKQAADERPFEGNFPRPLFPNFGGGVGVRTASSTIKIDNGEYTITSDLDGLKTTIRGRKEEKGFVPSSIEIVDGETNVKADSFDKVPEKYRRGVEKIVEKIR